LQAAVLDQSLNAIGVDRPRPTHVIASALHDYQHDGMPIVFCVTALGSILIVTYVGVLSCDRSALAWRYEAWTATASPPPST
jgi:hypothetical protein